MLLTNSYKFQQAPENIYSHNIGLLPEFEKVEMQQYIRNRMSMNLLFTGFQNSYAFQEHYLTGIFIAFC